MEIPSLSNYALVAPLLKLDISFYSLFGSSSALLAQCLLSNTEKEFSYNRTLLTKSSCGVMSSWCVFKMFCTLVAPPRWLTRRFVQSEPTQTLPRASRISHSWGDNLFEEARLKLSNHMITSMLQLQTFPTKKLQIRAARGHSISSSHCSAILNNSWKSGRFP